jgi:hypothetical protein
MRNNRYKTISKSVLIVFSTISNTLLAQQQNTKSSGNFWQNVQFEVELVWALDQITLIFLLLQVLFIISMNM